MATKKKSASNVINDPTQSLQKFDLLDLQQGAEQHAVGVHRSGYGQPVLVGAGAGTPCRGGTGWRSGWRRKEMTSAPPPLE